ncbi:toll/interleukin-1 receptor domain-containing protein [Granulicella arctica]|uniref:toll/interleukin-1 receptor domain-containing protein n=1 Tax=Granulicella arctica TaxID=940613 RepID=UPI0021E00928|nr:toll/interleukin-1 receptor domain-containing protein [Granulicella arctica]
MTSDLLFSRHDIYSVLENQKNSLRLNARKAPESWASEDDAVIVNRLVTEFEIEVPQLQEAHIEMSQTEVDVDVSHDPMRFISNRSRPHYIKGLKFIFHIPFIGDGGLFEVQPASFTLNPPRGKVVGQELQFVYEATYERATGVKATMESELSKVKNYLNSLRPSAEQLKIELKQLATAEWQTRKSKFSERETLLSSFSFPERKQGKADNQLDTSKEVAAKAASQWHVFISHASEDKEAFAKPLAEELKLRGLDVWYDEYTLTVGDSLRRRIDEGLSRSKFGVVILSKAFFEKEWPQRELDGLAAREINGVKVILPVWHGVDQRDVLAFSPTLADRLGVSSVKGIPEVVTQLLAAMNR